MRRFFCFFCFFVFFCFGSSVVWASPDCSSGAFAVNVDLKPGQEICANLSVTQFDSTFCSSAVLSSWCDELNNELFYIAFNSNNGSYSLFASAVEDVRYHNNTVYNLPIGGGSTLVVYTMQHQNDFQGSLEVNGQIYDHFTYFKEKESIDIKLDSDGTLWAMGERNEGFDCLDLTQPDDDCEELATGYLHNPLIDLDGTEVQNYSFPVPSWSVDVDRDVNPQYPDTINNGEFNQLLASKEYASFFTTSGTNVVPSNQSGNAERVIAGGGKIWFARGGLLNFRGFGVGASFFQNAYPDGKYFDPDDDEYLQPDSCNAMELPYKVGNSFSSVIRKPWPSASGQNYEIIGGKCVATKIYNNQSQIVSYDKNAGEFAVYVVPGINTQIYDLYYEGDMDRLWYLEGSGAIGYIDLTATFATKTDSVNNEVFMECNQVESCYQRYLLPKNLRGGTVRFSFSDNFSSGSGYVWVTQFLSNDLAKLSFSNTNSVSPALVSIDVVQLPQTAQQEFRYYPYIYPTAEGAIIRNGAWDIRKYHFNGDAYFLINASFSGGMYLLDPSSNALHTIFDSQNLISLNMPDKNNPGVVDTYDELFLRSSGGVDNNQFDNPDMPRCSSLAHGMKVDSASGVWMALENTACHTGYKTEYTSDEFVDFAGYRRTMFLHLSKAKLDAFINCNVFGQCTTGFSYEPEIVPMDEFAKYPAGLSGVEIHEGEVWFSDMLSLGQDTLYGMEYHRLKPVDLSGVDSVSFVNNTLGRARIYHNGPMDTGSVFDATSNPLLSREIQVPQPVLAEFNTEFDTQSERKWTVLSHQDFDNSGVKDYLLFNNVESEAKIVFMESEYKTSQPHSVSASLTGWKIQSVVDTDNDGTQDIIWFNSTANEASIWSNISSTSLTPTDISSMIPVGCSLISSAMFGVANWVNISDDGLYPDYLFQCDSSSNVRSVFLHPCGAPTSGGVPQCGSPLTNGEVDTVKTNSLVGVSDFDGKFWYLTVNGAMTVVRTYDLLWFDSESKVLSIWITKGDAHLAYHVFTIDLVSDYGYVDPEVLGVGDFDGDGVSDDVMLVERDETETTYGDVSVLLSVVSSSTPPIYKIDFLGKNWSSLKHH